MYERRELRTYVIFDGGRCSMESMYSPLAPVATGCTRRGQRPRLLAKPGRRTALTILVQGLDLGRQLKRLGVLAVDLVDEFAEEAARWLWWWHLGRVKLKDQQHCFFPMRTSLGEGAGTHLCCSTRLAEPALIGHLVEFQGRFEAGEVERAQATSVTTQEVTFALTSVAKVVVGLHVRVAKGGGGSRPNKSQFSQPQRTALSHCRRRTSCSSPLPPPDRLANALPPPFAGLFVSDVQLSHREYREEGKGGGGVSFEHDRAKARRRSTARTHLNLTFLGRLALASGPAAAPAPLAR